jgi:hypothetical protein
VLLEGFSQLVGVLKKASQNFILYFLLNKAAQNLNSVGAFTEDLQKN